MTIHLDYEPIKTFYDQLLHVENDVYLSATPISVYQSDEDGEGARYFDRGCCLNERRNIF